MPGIFYNKIMQVIVNRADLVEPLAKKILLNNYKKHLRPDFDELNKYVDKAEKRLSKTKLLDINFAEVLQLINGSLDKFRNKINLEYKKQYRPMVNWLADNEHLVDNEQMIAMFSDDTHPSFLKNIAKTLDTNISYITNSQVIDTEAVLLRNIIDNESILVNLMNNNLDFWFVDSGYTNFLAEGRKPWHRLVNKHIHHQLTHLDFPADRLSMLPTMPLPWNKNGRKILVIESSDSHYQLYGTTREAWKDKIIGGLMGSTDRPFEFRAKQTDRKTRTTVYEDLMSNPGEYYCVISDCSAAAVESIWAGIPVITLNQHITNAVSRSEISDIDNLYYGPVGDWLCALTYSQFTKKEMQNGTAAKIMEKYYV